MNARFRLVSALAAAVLILPMCGGEPAEPVAQEQQQAASSGAGQGAGGAVQHDVSPPLRDIPPAAPSSPDDNREHPFRPLPPSTVRPGRPQEDPVSQGAS